METTTPADPSRRRALAALLALLIALPLVTAGLVAWSVRTEGGSAWLLNLVPGLRVTAPRGTLLGDFAAGRVEIALPGNGAVVVDGLRWTGLGLERGNGTWRLAVVIDRLEAAQVELRPGVSTSGGAASTAPSTLGLPIELRVGALQLAALRAPPLGETPLREIRAALHLGADGGTLHRVDDLRLAHGALRAGGAARIGTRAPLPLLAELTLQQDDAVANARWQARLQANGPLAAFKVVATVRAQPAGAAGVPPAPTQSLDLDAVLRPFAPWPLGALDARASGLDLSAFDAAAPRTALSGSASVTSEAMDRPARLQARLENPAAGRWNEARLPLRELVVELSARPDDPSTLELRALDAALGSAQHPAGRVQGSGRWARQGWSLDATLTDVQPSRLDARAAPLPFSGPLQLRGTPLGASVQSLELQADLAGRVPQRGRPASVQLKLDAAATRDAGGERLELREVLARSGTAVARLKGSAVRSAAQAPWRLQGEARLERFDPLPWWPGREDSPWRRGPHRLEATGSFDLTLPATTTGPGPAPLVEQLLALRGQAGVQLADSLLAGVPLRGQARWRNADGATAAIEAALESGSNRARLDGRFAGRSGSGDHWELSIDAPALAAFAPVWRLWRPDAADAALAGALQAQAQLDGRWPNVATRGDATANALQVDRLTLRSAKAHWSAGLRLDAALEAQLDVAGARLGPAGLDSAALRLQGTGRAHRLELRAQTPARPPAWVDTLQPAAGAQSGPSTALLLAEGSLVERAGSVDGWRGTLPQIELRGGEAVWLRSRDLALELGGLAQAPLRAALQPGRAELLGAVLRWERVAWQGADGSAPARLDARAALEPMAIAPVLARLQPDFGWGGDLRLGATLEVASAPSVRADIVLQRERGDLTVTDEAGTQALGLTDLRLGLNVADGTWSFTQGLAGSTLGVAAGAFVARTSPQALWPAPETPVSGVLELQVAQLGTWGPWVPAGWRLGGALRVSAGIGGTFAGPEYTGEVHGRSLSVRNFVQGVNISDGDVAIALQGATARIERFSARGGAGTLQIDGEATLGATPQARLRVEARQFQLLGRVDRRIVASGDATVQLERDKLQLDGKFGVDEGLVDFTRSDAPTLGDDVVVVRGNGSAAKSGEAANGGAAAVRLPTLALDLRVGLGERLRVRGRGLDTRLAGDLRITAPGGKMAVDGTVRAVEGHYAAYGQKLEIDKGELGFNGPADNPRLDIEATRPNLDVRVGVAVTGTATNPRVRLFSEPEMSEIDKLSWLVLGRASDGLGRTDTALLQRAALALLAGEKPGATDQVTQLIGLDEVSVRQSDGEVRETVVSLGKQLSRRWYVGYERSLNATAGTWQLIYRVAQRFTLRAQSGEDSSLDVIWTWRWN